MEETSFYATMASDASINFFPQNRPGHFKVCLDRPRTLPGRWEVALVSIHIPHTWYNFPADSHVVLFNERKDLPVIITPRAMDLLADKFEKPELVDEIHVTLPKGYYSTPSDIGEKLIDLVNYTIYRRNVNNKRSNVRRSHHNIKVFKFDYDPIKKKASLVDYGNNLLFSDDAGGHFEALGLPWSTFEPEILPDHPAYAEWKQHLSHLKYYKSPRDSELVTSLVKNPVIFIYCDFIEPKIVGDTQARLLRTVPISGNYSETVSSSLFRPFYLPVSSGYINTVQFELRNSKGKLIEFLSGEIILELHFRKCGLDM